MPLDSRALDGDNLGLMPDRRTDDGRISISKQPYFSASRSTAKAMRILLIKPRWRVAGGHYRFLEKVPLAPLSLGILAALSEGHSVQVVDRDWQSLPTNGRFDLVGITVTTFTSEQAYQLARWARERGAKVVFGGVHPSILPEECLKHADAIVIGEAEYVWRQILDDAQADSLERVYQADRPTRMEDVPIPRRDLLAESPWVACVQATRGCPNTCKYCYLPSVPWAGFRKRPVELVKKEVSSLRKKLLIFVDDNLFAERDYVLDLCGMLRSLKVNWSVQAPTTIGRDEKLLDAMADSGCWHVLVGFQSFNAKSLEIAAVSHNRADDYKDLVDKLHARRILVTGFFMFGFDSDGPDCFDPTVEMIQHIGVDEAKLYILTPYPGTKLYEQFEREGRVLPDTRRMQFGWSHAVFTPKQMSPEQLELGVQRSYDRLHGYFLKRLPRLMWRYWKMGLRHPRMARVMMNAALRRSHVSQKIAALEHGATSRSTTAEGIE